MLDSLVARALLPHDVRALAFVLHRACANATGIANEDHVLAIRVMNRFQTLYQYNLRSFVDLPPGRHMKAMLPFAGCAVSQIAREMAVESGRYTIAPGIADMIAQAVRRFSAGNGYDITEHQASHALLEELTEAITRLAKGSPFQDQDADTIAGEGIRSAIARGPLGEVGARRSQVTPA